MVSLLNLYPQNGWTQLSIRSEKEEIPIFDWAYVMNNVNNLQKMLCLRGLLTL